MEMPRYRPGVKDTAARYQEVSQFILKCCVNITSSFQQDFIKSEHDDLGDVDINDIAVDQIRC